MAPKRITKKLLKEKGVVLSHVEELECINSIEKLITYTDNWECDWIRYIRGPVHYFYLSKEKYGIAKGIIEKGDYALIIDYNRSFINEREDFEEIIRNLGCEILRKESD
jgi:hypothetical protein